MQTRTETKFGQELETKTNHRLEKKRKNRGRYRWVSEGKILFLLGIHSEDQKGNALNNPWGMLLKQGSFTGSSVWVHTGIQVE